jgi:hypothetical protein
MNEAQIENLLRSAPRPAPPEGLKSTLEDEIRLPAANPRRETLVLGEVPFWRRWLPALAYGVLLLGCFVMLAVQSVQVLQLRRENESLRAASANLDQLRQQNEDLQKVASSAQSLASLRKGQAEAEQLRAEIERLRQATQPLAATRAEHQRLLAEQAARQAPGGATAPMEEDPFAEAKQKGQRIACVNSLKQISLAARLWSNQHGDVLPSDFLSMSNELGSVKLLFCPGQTNLGVRPRTWAELNPAQISYEMLAPGVSETHPDVVFVRCPLHNTVGLVDGSVQQLGTNRHVREVDGFMKIVPAAQDPAWR